MRILVVEDDKDVAGFVVRGLREAGHVVEHADNGRDGLFMAASRRLPEPPSPSGLSERRETGRRQLL